MEASEVWPELTSMPNVSASDIKAAQSGLGRRVVKKPRLGEAKLNQIVLLLRKRRRQILQAMVNLYLKPSGYIQHYLHDAFEQFANDPDISLEVSQFLRLYLNQRCRKR